MYTCSLGNYENLHVSEAGACCPLKETELPEHRFLCVCIVGKLCKLSGLSDFREREYILSSSEVVFVKS